MDIKEFKWAVIASVTIGSKCVAVFVTEKDAKNFATLYNMCAEEMESGATFEAVKLPW